MMEKKLNDFNLLKKTYDWYYKELTLLGPERNLVQKIVRKSAILSLIYFVYQKKEMIKSYNPKITKTNHAYEEVAKIDSICNARGYNCLIVGIPSPNDVIKKVDLEQKYGFVFNEISWSYPDIENFNASDYDGKTTNNHFINSGHRKFYSFLKKKVDLHLKNSKPSE